MPKGPMRNQSWEKWAPPAAIHHEHTVGGETPLDDAQIAVWSHKVAKTLRTRHSWDERRAYDSNNVERHYHMQAAGIENEIIDQLGSQIWDLVTDELGESGLSPEGKVPAQITTPHYVSQYEFERPQTWRALSYRRSTGTPSNDYDTEDMRNDASRAGPKRIRPTEEDYHPGAPHRQHKI